ncbi:unnamed protein product [Rangifer tarandus platyrhynchus]|uniref:Uncharacterized protein n=2 Tax=Rangifer tarandus platyrhynchus TaxID=3082113 RepID=A0AC59Z8D0_RANTA|nr:unnamed protein product [Rangifer tarandus platyrhynchus]
MSVAYLNEDMFNEIPSCQLYAELVFEQSCLSCCAPLFSMSSVSFWISLCWALGFVLKREFAEGEDESDFILHMEREPTSVDCLLCAGLFMYLYLVYPHHISC